ncbi:hypothetical protein ABZ820_34850 [Streptomyces diacarni]|uniref:hypothetical protein n=1 Tax=Streptomyces diacarni TaxID=2800381 RepID=UPI0033C9FFDD
MSTAAEIATVTNTIAAAALGWNATGRKPADLYHAMAERLYEAGLIMTPEHAAELSAAPRVIYRAEHIDGITLGHYATRDAARAHCVALVKREEPYVESAEWRSSGEDDEAPESLTVVVGGREIEPGYIVTPLTVASEYDEEADE